MKELSEIEINLDSVQEGLKLWISSKRDGTLFDGIETAFANAPDNMGWPFSLSVKMSWALMPSTIRFSSNNASIFRRWDLPEPKNPEIQTPLAVS